MKFQPLLALVSALVMASCVTTTAPDGTKTTAPDGPSVATAGTVVLSYLDTRKAKHPVTPEK